MQCQHIVKYLPLRHIRERMNVPNIADVISRPIDET